MTAGALTLNTDVLPGAKQISEIQEVIEERDIKCIFSEPQFNPKIIETIAQDTGIKTGVLDPLGSIFDANKMQYFKLINDLGNKLKDWKTIPTSLLIASRFFKSPVNSTLFTIISPC